MHDTLTDLNAHESGDEDRDVELADDGLCAGQEARDGTVGRDVSIAESGQRGKAEIEHG